MYPMWSSVFYLAILAMQTRQTSKLCREFSSAWIYLLPRNSNESRNRRKIVISYNLTLQRVNLNFWKLISITKVIILELDYKENKLNLDSSVDASRVEGRSKDLLATLEHLTSMYKLCCISSQLIVLYLWWHLS